MRYLLLLLLLGCVKDRDIKLSGPSVSISRCEEDKSAELELECRCTVKK